MRAILMTATLASMAALSGCASTPAPAAGALRPVAITFEVVAGGQPVRCGMPLAGGLGSDARRATLRDARFYVQDVALIRADGARIPVLLNANDWQNKEVTLLDFEDATDTCAGGTPATNGLISGTVPAGRYTGLAFTVGVPPALNHTSTELEGAPLDIAAMGWSWQAGRKFAKIEIDPEGGVIKADGSRSASWYVHLGSTGCTGNPVTGAAISCLRSNRIPLVMDQFDPSSQRVELNLNALFQSSRLSEDRGGAVGCMSGPTDPECEAIFDRIGLSLNEGAAVDPRHSHVFSAARTP